MKAEKKSWQAPEFISREQCVRDTEEVLACRYPHQTNRRYFRTNVLGMDWDIGMVAPEPEDSSKVPVGADGKKTGIYLLHGGSGDLKCTEAMQSCSQKFGYKVLAVSFPGRSISPIRPRLAGKYRPRDGTVRTPIWKKGEVITPDQYDVVKDTTKRKRYGTRTFAKPSPTLISTTVWLLGRPPSRKAEGSLLRNFPEGEYSIYVHGHSTGGPFVSMLSQRVPTWRASRHGTSPFGYIYCERASGAATWERSQDTKKSKRRTGPTDPLKELYIRSWRDLARYQGPEA